MWVHAASITSFLYSQLYSLRTSREVEPTSREPTNTSDRSRHRGRSVSLSKHLGCGIEHFIGVSSYFKGGQ